MTNRAVRVGWLLLWGLIIVTAFYLRASGLFRGMEGQYHYHPDEPKQVQELSFYLNGRYLGYRGHWHYDGYPYGLNRVDEWLMRPYRAGYDNARKNLSPQYERPLIEPRANLFRDLRCLRVLYGMTTLAFLVMAVRLLGFSRKQQLLVGGLFALAPLSAVVTHTATGDIGPDLFGTLSLIFLFLYARYRHSLLLFPAGLAVGCAFACKYNGIVTGLPLAIVVTGIAIYSRSFKRFVLGGVICLVGALAGAILLTPSMMIDWDQSWKNIIGFLGYIGDDKAPEAWLEATGPRRILIGLANNTTPVCGAIGWMLLVSSFVGLTAAVTTAWSQWRKKAERFPLTLAVASVSFFAWFGLLLSMSGKASLQPFHVSFIVPGMIISAVYGLAWLKSRGNKTATTVCLLLLLSMFIETGARACRENFFWRHDDTAMHGLFADSVLNEKAKGEPALVKAATVELDNMSAFRNQRKDVMLLGGAYWNEAGILPAPTVEMPWRSDLVFMHGPVFPRNDRHFFIPPSRPFIRYLIFHEPPPEAVYIGLRTGMWPADVTVDVSGNSRRLVMPPNAENILRMPARVLFTQKPYVAGEPTSYLVALEVSCEVGDVWATVMQSGRELSAYRLFGPGETGAEDVEPFRAQLSDLAPRLATTRFLENLEPMKVVLTASDPYQANALLSPSHVYPFRYTDHVVRPRLSSRLVMPVLQQMSAASLALPAGPYVFECDVMALTDQAEMELWMADTDDLRGLTSSRKTLSVDHAVQTVSLSFTKGFAPYQCFAAVTCLKGDLRITGWRVRPDGEQLAADLSAWLKSGTAPAWRARLASERETFDPDKTLDVDIAGQYTLHDVSLPETIHSGKSFYVGWYADYLGGQADGYGDLDVFLHFISPEGEQVAASGFVLWQGIAAGSLSLPIEARGVPLKPATYNVYAGIWNRRSRTVLKVSNDPDGDTEQGDKKVFVGSVTVLSEE